jgi:hypothetical protein
MPLLASKELFRSENPSVETTSIRPRISLGNEVFDPPPNPQLTDIRPQSQKSVEKIPTFIIWSIFNLLFPPFGILCCYFSYKVNLFKKQNRYEIAKTWSKRTFVLNIITTLLIFGVIITVYMLHYDYVQRNPPLIVNETRTTGAFIQWQPGR